MVAARELAAVLVLLRTHQLSWGSCADLIEDHGSALTALDRSRAQWRRQTSLFDDDDARFDSLLASAERDVAMWRNQGLGVLSVLDPEYPENLRAVHDRPPLVFVAGRLKRHDARAIAVIGAREATPAGIARASAISAHLARHEYTVVSGLAAGIDTAAHTAALARGGRTVAVLGTGVMRSYPPQNVVLQRRIAAQCAVVSPFLPDAPPTRTSFPMRNGVMSGLALASVIVEASRISGARIQARLALAHGRPVFLVRSLLSQTWARELAERPATYVIEDPGEITTVVERLTSAAPLVA